MLGGSRRRVVAKGETILPRPAAMRFSIEGDDAAVRRFAAGERALYSTGLRFSPPRGAVEPPGELSGFPLPRVGVVVLRRPAEPGVLPLRTLRPVLRGGVLATPEAEMAMRPSAAEAASRAAALIIASVESAASSDDGSLLPLPLPVTPDDDAAVMEETAPLPLPLPLPLPRLLLPTI